MVSNTGWVSYETDSMGRRCFCVPVKVELSCDNINLHITDPVIPDLKL